MLSCWEQTVTNEFGDRIDQPTVRVQYELPGEPNAVLKTDKLGVTPLDNPFTPAEGIDPRFYVAGGFYKITITKGAYTKVLRDVPLGTAAAMDSPPFTVYASWDSVTEFPGNALLRHGNGSYFAIQPSVDVEPAVDSGWDAYWFALAVDGDDGASVPLTGLSFPEQASAPDAPSAGTLLVYAKDDSRLYTKDSAGTEAELGGGSITVALFNELVLTTSLLALQVADNTNLAIFAGDNGNRVFDSFDALAYVDVAGATNLDTSAGGLLKPTTTGGVNQVPTMSSNTAPSGVASASSVHSSSAAFRGFDGNTAVGDGTNDWLTNAVATGWLQYQFTAAKTIATYRITSGNGQAARAPRNFTLQGSNNGSSWTTIDTRTDQTGWTAGGETRTYTVASPGSYSYYRLDVTLNNGDGSWLEVAEVQLRDALTTNNVTVRSASFTAAFAPAKMKAIIRVKEVDAAVAGTDYTFEVSRDGGTAWTAATLTGLFTSPSPTASIRVCETDEVDVSGQPSGTSPRWRFNTLNNKMIELHDAALYWA